MDGCGNSEASLCPLVAKCLLRLSATDIGSDTFEPSTRISGGSPELDLPLLNSLFSSDQAFRGLVPI